MSGTRLRLGLMSAPELPAQIAAELAEELPELLARRQDGCWEVVLAEEPLLAGREGVGEIFDAAAASRAEEGWDAVLCLTDVPLRDGARPLAAAVAAEERIAVVDVPAFGATLVKPRVREAAVSLVAEIADEAIEGSHRLVRPRPTEALTPITRHTVKGERAGIRYVLPAVLGHARLLGGMVRAIRPWRAFTGLGAAVVAAFGTGAYALLSTTIWQLSARLPWPRLIAIMLVSVAAMVVWLIAAHDLWEGKQILARRKEAALYNTATALTITIAVLCGYLALFVLLYAVCAVLIEGQVFKSNAGETAGAGTYAALAWLGAAIGTVAGALGSKFESIERVRRATYGHNQRRE